MHSITVVLFLAFVAFFVPILLKLGIGLTILQACCTTSLRGP